MISVVIPTLNRASLLDAVLPSYLRQSDVGEVVVVDDGSKDGTVATVSAWSVVDDRVRLVRHLTTRGLPAARNTGVATANGTLVLFGEDDAEPAPDYTATLAAHMETGEAAVAAGRLVYALPGNEFESPAEQGRHARTPIDLRVFVGEFDVHTSTDTTVPFVHALSLVRRAVLLEYPFDESTYVRPYFREETDFYLRVYTSGGRILFCPHTHVVHKARPDGYGTAGGIWTGRTIEYQILRHYNNARFIHKHRLVLRSDFRRAPLRLFGRLLGVGLLNQARRTAERAGRALAQASEP